MAPENRKQTRVKLIVLGVLSLLLAVNQTVLYLYANAHLKEILHDGSSKLFGLFPVTQNAAYANPNLTVAVFGVLLSAVCFFAVHHLRKHSGEHKE